MANINFKTNPVSLDTLLGWCGGGKVQLPDFQRSWVWDVDRIRSLLSSVSRGFPIGALMTLATKPRGEATVFACRPIQGASHEALNAQPEQLLLDGQQRMTSLYQTCARKEVVEALTAKKKLVRLWFYIDIRLTLTGGERDDAIVAVPEDRRVKSNFGRDIELDVSSPELEYANLMFPVNRVFDWDEWQDGFTDHWRAKGDDTEQRNLFRRFKNEILQNFKAYQVPDICLDHDTSIEAVCVVFEKVNTGGKALDAFELLTAMYAAKGYRLRDDWLGAAGAPGLRDRLAALGRPPTPKDGVLAKVASTDFLQAIALLHSRAVRAEAVAAGQESELPPVRATRPSLLDLPLDAYERHRDAVEEGFRKVVTFLKQQYVHRVLDLPYQTQLVPLAAIFAELGDAAEHAATQEKLARWYWCGVFGELYSSAVESRFAKDIVEVLEWVHDGPVPSTVREGVFRADRLYTLRSRLSAAYKGIHALLMRKGAKDFRTGRGYEVAVFFDDNVDIHHIFPEAWCKAKGIDVKVYDTVINKTPLSFRTNRKLGGVAPSEYLARLEGGMSRDGEDPAIPREALDEYLESHCVPVESLRADDFDRFMEERRRRLLGLVATATGHQILDEATPADEGVELGDQLARDVAADSMDAQEIGEGA